MPAASQPKQHVVAAGETAWSIARKYNVSVNDLAQWNGLRQDMTLRETRGQGIRTHQHHGGERLCRPGSGRLSGAPADRHHHPCRHHGRGDQIHDRERLGA
ncbi:LysM domain-containing protein [Paracoccus sp. APAP_BH8]